MQPSFFWYDFETFGLDPVRDRPAQFAGVRTDLDFRVLGKPLVLYCRPSADYLPHPEACLLTGITPQVSLERGLVEAQFAARIHDAMSQPGTCNLGFNSIRFDDEVMRQCLYRNFFDPYLREWFRGNSRWDLLDVVRCYHALDIKGICWPKHEDGRVSFKLEQLAAANDLAHEHAHDALSDVYATIALGRFLKQLAPALFADLLSLRDKNVVSDRLNLGSLKPVVHVSGRFDVERGCISLVLPLAVHPEFRNNVIAWDLRCNPEPLLDWDAIALREQLFTPSRPAFAVGTSVSNESNENSTSATHGLALTAQALEAEMQGEGPVIGLKQIHLNRAPVVLPVGMVTPELAQRWQLDGSVLRQHLAEIRNYCQRPSNQRALSVKLAEIYTQPLPFSQDSDLMLYSGGFFKPSDKAVMEQIRKSDPAQLARFRGAFADPRGEEMLFRYRARNFPDTLAQAELKRWEDFCSARLADAGESVGLTLTEYFDLLKALGTPERNETQKKVLQALCEYGESLGLCSVGA